MFPLNPGGGEGVFPLLKSLCVVKASVVLLKRIWMDIFEKKTCLEDFLFIQNYFIFYIY